LAILCIFSGGLLTMGGWAEEPAALDPFAPRAQPREDAVPGYLELSDGTIKPGQVFLTREHRLKVFDPKEERQREIPLRAIQAIDCRVVKEWQEKEWRFKENASDEKYFTGRSYPAREYSHTITLGNGRTIAGPLSAIVYVQAEGADMPERFLLHKRDKGELDAGLSDLMYVRSIRLGPKALEEGKRKAAQRQAAPAAKGR
jgi:hypothetical protein